MTDRLTAARTALSEAAGVELPVTADSTRIALFGVWNAGKSTLLKRLLVELGHAVPDWVTVAAAPETNFVGEVALDDELVLLDTPGISDGMSLHEGEVARALAAADVVIVLLLPALLTAEKDEVVAILRGEHVHALGWPWPEGALKVIVSQLDQGGFDPVEDSAGYSVFAQEKLADLGRILSDSRVSLPEPPVSVIADLHGEVSDDRDGLALSDYTRGDWDGVQALLAWLRATPHELVREHAATRRLVSAASQQARVAREAANAVDAQGRVLHVELEELVDRRDSLTRKLEEAESDLADALEVFAASIYGADLDEADQALSERQQAVVDAWLARQQTWLEGAELELGMDGATFAAGRLGGADSWAVLDALAADPALGPSAMNVIEEIFGADLDGLRAELAKTNDNEYWKDTARLFKNEGHARVAQGVLVATASIPVLLQLAGVVREVTADPTPEHERRVNELRASVRGDNSRAVASAIEVLRDYVDSLATVLDDEIARRQRLITTATAGAEGQRARERVIEGHIEDLRAALRQG